MVVSCPKCKTKLKVQDEKIKPAGTTFKCPKCATLLRVKKPVAARKAVLDPKKVVVAHARAAVMGRMVSELMAMGYGVVTAFDGVDVMVKAMKERAGTVVADIATSRISGYDLARRLKERAETRGVKIILVSSQSDPDRQRKTPPETFGVDGYVDEGRVDELRALLGPGAAAADKGPRQAAEKPAPAATPAFTLPTLGEAGGDPDVERARRLARTVLSDIELYNPNKVAESIRSDKFQSVFADELKEGLKHYERRITPEVRGKGNFFQEAVDNFIERKRKSLGLD